MTTPPVIAWLQMPEHHDYRAYGGQVAGSSVGGSTTGTSAGVGGSGAIGTSPTLGASPSMTPPNSMTTPNTMEPNLNTDTSGSSARPLAGSRYF